MPSGLGTLFVVGTPIGNMEDITLRALRVLRDVDLIAAEDTRHTGLLLARLSERVGDGGLARLKSVGGTGACGEPAESVRARELVAQASRLRPRLVSYHEFNEAKRTPELLKELQQGRSIALVSDAGMPTVSDPGQRLIRAVIDAGISIEIIPGVSAVTTALVASGIPGVQGSHRVVRGSPDPARHLTEGLPITTQDGDRSVDGIGAVGEPSPTRSAKQKPSRNKDCQMAKMAVKSGSFLFYGFLPHKSGQRRTALTRLAPLPYTVIFFESPYRLLKSLRDMHEVLGNRHIVVARELTKKFEEILRGDIEAILKKLENRAIKGEITLVVEGSRE